MGDHKRSETFLNQDFLAFSSSEHNSFAEITQRWKTKKKREEEREEEEESKLSMSDIWTDIILS